MELPSENDNENSDENDNNYDVNPELSAPAKPGKVGMKILGKYDISEVKVNDPGLKRYINLDARLVPKSHGRNRDRFGKARVNIIERFANLIAVPGHRGKKHKLIKGEMTGKYNKSMAIIMQVFQILEKDGNPVQMLVQAIENSAPRDEVTAIEYGGARYPQAVDVAPYRRLGLAMRYIIHGASDKAFNKKKEIGQALAEEIRAAAAGSGESYACSKRNEAEKQADSAR